MLLFFSVFFTSFLPFSIYLHLPSSFPPSIYPSISPSIHQSLPFSIHAFLPIFQVFLLSSFSFLLSLSPYVPTFLPVSLILFFLFSIPLSYLILCPTKLQRRTFQSMYFFLFFLFFLSFIPALILTLTRHALTHYLSLTMCRPFSFIHATSVSLIIMKSNKRMRGY